MSTGYPKDTGGLAFQGQASQQPVVLEEHRGHSRTFQGVEEPSTLTFSEGVEVVGFALKHLLIIFQVNERPIKDGSL